ncbi:MAG: ABC transporter ATP-binding protein [Candidatus Poseidoniaceae archaeon]|nr:ABC transporter ATP-binding protein [Candidatus Poseidoniaceae archaeon]MBL6890064.1 ABC transporter ATP-binding protein [Candidatus Poseidoniaceae archaeon]
MEPIEKPLRSILKRSDAPKGKIRLAILCSILNKIWDLAPPLLIGVAVDVVVRKEDSLLADWGIIDPWNQLLVLAVATFVIWGLESLFEYFYAILWRNLAQTVQHNLRLVTFDHVQHQAMSWFDEHQKGDLLAVMNDDVNQLERFLDKGANDLLQVTTTVIVVGSVFLFLSWEIALFAVLPIPVILWGSFLYQKKLQSRYQEVRHTAGQLNALLENDLTGMATIQSFTSEEKELKRVEALSESYRGANKSAIRLSAAFVPLIRMAILAGFTATLLLGGKLALDGVLAVGAYSVLVFMTQRLLWPLTRLGETFDLYQRAMASSVRILTLLERPSSIIDGNKVLHRDDARVDSILFKNVSFAYPEREELFTDFNMELESGTTIGVVGTTGSGKTTLTRFLLRFAEPSEGEIIWGDHSIADYTLSSLRDSIALVSQHVTLFPTTIRENIRYGKEDATDKEIEDAAVIAEAFDYIEALPKGWNTLVGEGGYRLSGGQRQRIAIARAILKDAPLLILDEATSAVDNETEAALQRSIAKISLDRTTMIVAHRLSTVRNAHRILVFENGSMIENGTHDDLVDMDGKYAALWRVQTGSNIE